MSTPKFFGLSCLIFVVLGPLVSLTARWATAGAIEGGISTLVPFLAIFWIAYLYRGLIVVAVALGFLFASCAWLLARFAPLAMPTERAWSRAPFGALLGLSVALLYVGPRQVILLYSLLIDERARGRPLLSLLYWWDLSGRLEFHTYMLPSLICGVVAAACHLPKFRANTSVHGTTSGLR